MRVVSLFAILFVFSPLCAADGSLRCGDIAKINKAIDDLSEYYGDVNVALKCKSTNVQTEKLICSDSHLLLMYKLNSMAEVYAIENATKQEINHSTYIPLIPKCKDKICLCNAFRESTNDSMGGESPYYVEQ